MSVKINDKLMKDTNKMTTLSLEAKMFPTCEATEQQLEESNPTKNY